MAIVEAVLITSGSASEGSSPRGSYSRHLLPTFTPRDKTNEEILGSLRQASGKQNLVLLGDINYADICCKNNTAAHMSPIKFLECVKDCFFIQKLDVPTRNEALLNLQPTNQGNLLCDIC